MRQAWRAIAGLFAIGVLTTGGSVALADNGGRDNNGNRGNNAGATTSFTMPGGPNGDGNPEGIAVDKRSGRLLVSRTRTGSISAGALNAPTTPLATFITGPGPNAAATPVATGMKIRRGLLYVAGASTGQIRVYDLANPTTAPKVFETGGGFINDLDLDGDGNVFATDSTKSTIYEVTAAQVAAGAGTPQGFDVSSGITSTPGKFNLNGIVARGDTELIVVNSDSGELFRIRFDGNDAGDRGADDQPSRTAQVAGTPKIEKIDLGGATVKGGDGLLVDRGRLLVVRGSNTGDPNANPAGAKGLIDVVKLSHHRTRGRVESEVFDPSFAGPSTIARAGNRLLVVNANFAAGPDAAQYTVTSLSRNAVRHGRHGGRGR